MSFESAWDWAGGLPSAPTGEICESCHNCLILYEDIAERVMRALELQGSGHPHSMISMTPPRVERADELLRSKLARLKRISGLYARSFQKLEMLGVHIPFVGTAAFTSNLVGWEAELQFGTILGLHPDWSDPRQNGGKRIAPISLGFALGSLIRAPTFPVAWSTIHRVFDGNAVVFVEIFAIIDFVIRHIERFGKPQGDDLDEFEDCLRSFVEWWDRVQPSHRTVPSMADIRVDRDGLIVQGIMECLRGNSLRGSLRILENEQRYTLQQYMYDLVDLGYLDAMEIGLHIDFKRVASRFAYNLYREDIPERYTVPWKPAKLQIPLPGRGILGWSWITEYDDRMPYAIDVVTKFNDLYYGNASDRAYLVGEHAKLSGDANGY